MAETSVNERIKQELAEFLDAVSRRAAAERELAESAPAASGSEALAYQQAVQAVEGRYSTARASAELKGDTESNEAIAEFESQSSEINRQSQQAIAQADKECEAAVDAIQREKQDARWMVKSVLDDESEQSPKHQLEKLKKQLSGTKDRLEQDRTTLEEEFGSAVSLEDYPLSAEVPVEGGRPHDRNEALERFEAARERSREGLARLKKQTLAWLFSGWRLAVMFLLLAAAVFVPLYLFVDPALLGFASNDPTTWLLAAGGGSLVFALFVSLVFLGTAQLRSGRLATAVQESLSELRATQKMWLHFARAEMQEQQRDYKARYGSIVKQRQQSLAKIDATEAQTIAECQQRREAAVAEAQAKLPALLRKITEQRDQRLQKINEELGQALAQMAEQRNAELHAVHQQYAHSHAASVASYEQKQRETAGQWGSAVNRFERSAEELGEYAQSITPEWSSLLEKGWKLPTEAAPGIQYGHYLFDLDKVDEGLPADASLRPAKTTLQLPAVVPFPERPSLLYKARGDGRRIAVESIRTVMLRLLTSLPAGKVRFTIIDPSGLGENFSAFMHLADYDDAMVGTRIWTETSHIEKRLSELTEHMENVFQVYLRNEFETIEDYNREAGEVAEPYQFLIVANFPANFSDSAARRLASIATSGPRCGVYTLISVDLNQSPPHGFDVGDLETNSTVLGWSEGKFFSNDPAVSALPLVLDAAPPAETFTGIVRSVGEQSRDMRRVEVPFERIAPREDRLWSRDSRTGIDVPLGPAGATKLQHLSLGKGTSQHVLVAGKTGSGKSSFLHAMITNVALYYGPSEIEFYLIDFKKGVEFKTYATHRLPHARVIGIESDREFGVSVLERLDEILRERGELFRSIGVQDINGFRKARPEERMPRIMLIVDEFQEFFVEDDPLSQGATLLLDRLVRQGRAFGIHVLLGSQTLGGAYSLARSTLGQVAVRIALQCSESDAHLILSEENTAARLLSRPGEAIYNDANGLVEGNHPFQIAWLGDERRDHYLQQVKEKTRETGVETSPPIVFEGHVASDLRRNRELVALVESFGGDGAATQARDRTAQRVWVGEAVSIKPATEFAFQPRAGSNLLIVGQELDSVYGLMSALFITLAARQEPASQSAPTNGDGQTTDEGSTPAQFYIFDGDLAKPGDTSPWTRVLETVPHATRVCGQNGAPAVMAELSEEVSRRTAQPDADRQPVFVFVSNLGRFRDLRKDDDDFGFSSMGEEKPTSPGKQFTSILREGPAVGVHVIVWCDTYGNLSRWMGTQTLREFEIRIAFRMNASDSSNLLESPIASKLGPHRALLQLAEQGNMEKFRPYGPPDEKSLEWLAEHLNGGAPAAPSSTPGSIEGLKIS